MLKPKYSNFHSGLCHTVCAQHLENLFIHVCPKQKYDGKARASGVLCECLSALVSMSECAHSALCFYCFYITRPNQTVTN